MIQKILNSKNFVACLLAAATGMTLYFRVPFPDENIVPTSHGPAVAVNLLLRQILLHSLPLFDPLHRIFKLCSREFTFLVSKQAAAFARAACLSFPTLARGTNCSLSSGRFTILVS